MSSSSGPPNPPRKERRAWVRYPSEAVTTIQTNSDAERQAVPARVRHISLGGIDLLVERAVERGTMVNVELPGASEERITVLACVVHVTPQDAHTWILGCTFAHELAAEDLQSLGVQRLRAPLSDQRSWVRLPCRTKAAYHLVNGVPPKPMAATVANISPNGLRLLVPQAVDPGYLLNVELEGTQGKGTLTILVCVVHVSAVADGEWALGCTFIRELDDKEFQALR
jgi:hypothetical protein